MIDLAVFSTGFILGGVTVLVVAALIGGEE